MIKKLLLLSILIAVSKPVCAHAVYRAPFYDKAMAQIQVPVLHVEPAVTPIPGTFADDRRRHHRHDRLHRIPRTPEQRYTGLIVSGSVLSAVGVSGVVLGAATLHNDSKDNPVSLGVLILGGILLLLGTSLFLAGWYIRSNYKSSVEIIEE